MKQKLYLDDVRKGPADAQTVRSAKSALGLLRMQNAHFNEWSLDHDLGSTHMDGTWFLKMVDAHQLPMPETIHLHTQNPIGRMRMAQMLEEMGYERDPLAFASFHRPADHVD